MSYGENIFTGMIDEDGVIWDMATGRKRQKVGVDCQREQELVRENTEIKERLDTYYAKLVDLGVITPPKTSEQIAAEAAQQQNAFMSQMMETLAALKQEVKELKTCGNSGHGDVVGGKPSGQNSKENRQKPAGNQGSA